MNEYYYRWRYPTEHYDLLTITMNNMVDKIEKYDGVVLMLFRVNEEEGFTTVELRYKAKEEIL